MDSDSDWRVSCPTIQDKNLYLLNSEFFSDVIFLVGERKERVHAHRLILVAASPVFEAQFGDRWEKENEIEIPDVSPITFRKFLEYLYADNFSVTANEAPEFLFLAHKYLTNLLAKKCSDVLGSVINVSNVVQIHQTATKFNEEDLKKKAMEFILKNGSAVCEDIGFIQIDKDTLASILKSDKLVADEILIFRAVMRWAENRCIAENLNRTVENKRIVLKDLTYLIRFTLMSAEDFTNEVNFAEHDGILTEAESNTIYKYLNAGSSLRSLLPIFPFNVNKRSSGTPYQVDVYEAGVQFVPGTNCRYGFRGRSTPSCYEILGFSSNQNICLKGIELRQTTQSGVNLRNPVYLAFNDSGSANTETSDINASIFISDTSSVSVGQNLTRNQAATFVQNSSFRSAVENGVQIKKDAVYQICLIINGGYGESLIPLMRQGVRMKLENPGNVICEGGDVKFTFGRVSSTCFHEDYVDDWGDILPTTCICTGQIKTIHFTI